MVENLMGDNMTSDRIYKLDVNFEIVEKGIVTFIGRRAHILFLEN